MPNVTEVQDEILAHLKNSIPQRVLEQAIPDVDTVLKNANGQIQPYITLQFGDLQERYGSGQGLVGVRHNDYELPVYVQTIAGEPEIARKLAMDKVLDALLGLDFPWTGQIRKRPGGGMWPLISSSGATEAYMYPVSFAITIQLNDQ